MYVQIQVWNYTVGIVQIDGINPSVLLFILLYSVFPEVARFEQRLYGLLLLEKL